MSRKRIAVVIHFPQPTGAVTQDYDVDRVPLVGEYVSSRSELHPVTDVVTELETGRVVIHAVATNPPTEQQP